MNSSTMRRKSLIAILWLVAILCFSGVFASQSWIESWIGHTAVSKPPKGNGFLAILFTVDLGLRLGLRICIVAFFGVGALVSVWFALWMSYTPNKKSNLPSPRTQAEDRTSGLGPPPPPPVAASHRACWIYLAADIRSHEEVPSSPFRHPQLRNAPRPEFVNYRGC